MDDDRGRRLRSFLLGGLLGSVAGLAAAGRMKVKQPPGGRETPAGLAAFEQAPCYEELVQREARESDSGASAPPRGAGRSRPSRG